MTMILRLAIVLLLVGVASCQTPPKEKSEIKPTEPQVITKTTTLPGKVVSNPYPTPDSSLTPDPEPLTEEHITGDDISPEAAMATAVAWSKQYHDLSTTYDILRGWIIGVRAGQKGVNVPDETIDTP